MSSQLTDVLDSDYLETRTLVLLVQFLVNLSLPLEAASTSSQVGHVTDGLSLRKANQNLAPLFVSADGTRSRPRLTFRIGEITHRNASKGYVLG